MSASTASSDRASPLLLPYRRRPQSPATAVATGPPPPPVSHHPTRVPRPYPLLKREEKTNATSLLPPHRRSPALHRGHRPLLGMGPQGQFWPAQFA
jgi:hypothetical protein